MKISQILLISLTLTACAKAPETSPPPAGKSSTEILSVFHDTRQQKEESLLQITAAALRAGAGLDRGQAEKCWREEAARPVIRESCVLLWAGQGESSPELENALLGGRSRILSLALLQRKPLIGRVSFSDLLSLLHTLAQDPLWARAEMAAAWLELRGNPGITESESLLALIRPPEGAGPRDIASALKAIRLLRAGAWQEVMSTYCDPAASGESRLRCWRVLAALGPDGRRAGPLLPSFSDDDWLLFNRSFPRLAERFRAYLR